jgi:hypothetical protein
VPVKLDDFFGPIWIPDKYLEIKAHTEQNFVSGRVGDLSYGLLMAFQLFNGFFRNFSDSLVVILLGLCAFCPGSSTFF